MFGAKMKTYVNGKGRGYYEAWQCKPIGDLLDSVSGRSQCRRRHIRSAEVVDDTADSDVGARDDRLASVERSVVLVRITHLCNDGEEGRRPRKCEDE